MNVEIPTQPNRPFSERVSLRGVSYTLFFSWNVVMNCWVVDVYDESGRIPVILGMPLVTGSDLLEQFGYLAIGADAIWTVMTVGPDVSPDSVPTFDNLGVEGRLYMTSP